MLVIIEMQDGSVREVELTKAKGAKIRIEKEDGSFYEVDLKTVKKVMIKP
jgi:hypothetical protein